MLLPMATYRSNIAPASACTFGSGTNTSGSSPQAARAAVARRAPAARPRRAKSLRCIRCSPCPWASERRLEADREDVGGELVPAAVEGRGVGLGRRALDDAAAAARRLDAQVAQVEHRAPQRDAGAD